MSQLALIVEDEDALRIIYESVLHDLGFDVLQAADGEEAIRMLAEITPQLVFLDILMPKVDGSQVLQYIHKAPHLHNTATIIITAHSRYQSMISLTANDLFLLKPVRPRDIQAAVHQVIAIP